MGYLWCGDEEWTDLFERRVWELFLRRDLYDEETMRASKELNRKGDAGSPGNFRFLGLHDFSLCRGVYIR